MQYYPISLDLTTVPPCPSPPTSRQPACCVKHPHLASRTSYNIKNSYGYIQRMISVMTATYAGVLLLLLVSFNLPAPRVSLSNVFQFPAAEKALVCGDGDFSFARALVEKGVYESVCATTLDTPERLVKSFPKAAENVAAILQCERSRGSIQYEVDATKLPYQNEFDAVIWNFPHVPGKANIRYNRILLEKFFTSAAQVIRPEGQIFCSLVEGQSGVGCASNEEWDVSWKLPHQVAEAGLLLTGKSAFDVSAFPGYEVQGKRGHGGGFRLGDAQMFTAMRPNAGMSISEQGNSGGGTPRNAIHAPIYTHEVHMYADEKTIDWAAFERRVSDAASARCKAHGYEHCLWSVHLVDVYVCPNEKRVSYAVQLAYCSLSTALGRTRADRIRTIMEEELPAVLMLEPRTSKHGRMVSKPLQWYVAKILKDSSIADTTALCEQLPVERAKAVDGTSRAPSCDHIDPVDADPIARELRKLECVAEVARTPEGVHGGVHGAGATGTPNSNVDRQEGSHAGDALAVASKHEQRHEGTHGHDIEAVRALARLFWKRRSGVIANFKIYNETRKVAQENFIDAAPPMQSLSSASSVSS